MKIYIILEGSTDRIIRGVTICPKLAGKICNSFSYLGLFVEEYETLDNEELKTLLEVKKNGST